MTPESKTYEGSACAKIILLGEHAVVHDVPAIAFPVPSMRTSVTIYPTEGINIVHTEDEHGNEVPIRHQENAVRMVQAGLKMAGIAFPDAFRMDVKVSIPINAGLGSSGALSVAISHALFPEDTDTAELARLANKLDAVVHGTPSGMDTGVIAYEQPVLFTTGQGAKPIQLANPLRLAVAVLPRDKAGTGKLVAEVHKLKEKQDPRFQSFLDNTRSLVREGFRLITAEGSDEKRLGWIFDEAGYELSKLGLESEEQSACIQAMRQAGAMGAKLSGAGGGGATIALLHAEQDKKRDDAVLVAAQNAGAKHVFIQEYQ